MLLEQRGRKAIHDVVHKEMIECELDKNIKLAMVFDKRKDLQDKLGWFHGLRHTALRLFGLQVLDERADCEDVFALAKTSAVSSSAASSGMPVERGIECAIVLNEGVDTFWPARFVLEIFQRLIDREEGVVEGVSEGVAEGVAADGGGGRARARARGDSNSSQLQLHAHSMVTSVTKEDDGTYLVSTSRGNVRTRNVVHATNAWVGALVPPLGDVVRPVLNTMIATDPQTTPMLLLENTRRSGMSLQPGYNYVRTLCLLFNYYLNPLSNEFFE